MSGGTSSRWWSGAAVAAMLALAVGLVLAVGLLAWQARPSAGTDGAGPPPSPSGPGLAAREAPWPGEPDASRATPARTSPEPLVEQPGAARAASAFVEGAVDLPDEERTAWVRAFTTPVDRPQVAETLTAWIHQLNGGTDLEASGQGAHLRVRTLGYRTRAQSEAGDPTIVRLVLWQFVARERWSVAADDDLPSGGDYVLTFVSVRPDGDGYLVASLEGVVDGPSPGPGMAAIYPPIQSGAVA